MHCWGHLVFPNITMGSELCGFAQRAGFKPYAVQSIMKPFLTGQKEVRDASLDQLRFRMELQRMWMPGSKKQKAPENNGFRYLTGCKVASTKLNLDLILKEAQRKCSQICSECMSSEMSAGSFPPGSTVSSRKLPASSLSLCFDCW